MQIFVVTKTEPSGITIVCRVTESYKTAFEFVRQCIKINMETYGWRDNGSRGTLPEPEDYDKQDHERETIIGSWSIYKDNPDRPNTSDIASYMIWKEILTN